MTSHRKRLSRRHQQRKERRAQGLTQVKAAPVLPPRGSVDVVVTAHVVVDRLGPCLQAVKRELPDDATVIVADSIAEGLSASLHEDVARTAREAGVRVDRSGRGRWDARNRAAAHGQAPLILFLDTDAVLQDGAWAALVSAIEPEAVGAVGGLIVFDASMGPDNSPAPVVRMAGWAFNAMLQPYARFFGWLPDNPKLFARDDLQAVPAHFMLTRRMLFRSLGGFPADGYGGHPYADVEYCLQLKNRGLLIGFEPKAIVLAGREPVALSRQQLEEGTLILAQRAGHLIHYDEVFLL